MKKKALLSEFQALADDLQKRAGTKAIVYVPNPGNWGDGLIRYGTKLFFEDFGIRHLEVNIGVRLGKLALLPFVSPLHSRKYQIVLGGGGAWGRAYSGGYETAKFLSRTMANLVVLPSTYELPVSFRGGVFYSRGRVESLQACPGARFCHDMALYVAARPRGVNVFVEERAQVGVFMRRDRESAIAGGGGLPDSRDVSADGDHMSCGDSFIREVGQYKVVFTDRLHVAIAGCIAGRKVHLFPGNYFKIREIYEASLGEAFLNLTLHSNFEDFKLELARYYPIS